MSDAPTPDRTVLFVHGIGAGPESWNAHVAALPPDYAGVALTIPGLRDDDPGEFSLERAVAAVDDEIASRTVDAVHLCGLSLGAVIATAYAAQHPDRVASLVLSGGQVHPNPALMSIQSALMRRLPARFVTAPGMSKPTLLKALAVMGKVDLRDDLARITAPTLVMCGAKDRANLPAARALAAGIPRAELAIVAGAGHEWNVDMPAEFSERLNRWLIQVEP